VTRRHPRRSRARFVWLGLFAGALAALLAACRQPYPYNTLTPAGPVADKQADLFNIVFWIAVAVFVLVEGALVVAMIRFRSRGAGETPKQIHGNTRLEVIWTILPALLLAGVAVPTVGTLFDLADVPEGGLRVQVIGPQWWWEIQYPELDVITANEVHVPTDRPVNLTLRSDDVIHSFWVPRLAGKQDLIPGRDIELSISAPEPGTYRGLCAEYCGLSHANMRFRVIAQEPADFEAWVETQRSAAPAPPAGSEAAEGLEVFRNSLPQGTGTCIACHTVQGVEEAVGIDGPNLSHVGGRQTIAAGILPNTEEGLERWLRNPPRVKPGSLMPNYQLSDDQIAALVAFLRSLK
jgi:cytochrome c oxidase subunit 2